MQDRPTAAELLAAIQHFVETDVVPALDGTKKFHARVAANLLSILGRELASEDEQLAREWNGLSQLLGEPAAPPADRAERHVQLRRRSERLCERIRAGEADQGAWRDAVLRHVRATVVDKLAVANPRYLAGGRAAD
jgi:hypothetical protein